MIINLTFDQATSSLPSGFVASIDAVVQFYENLFTNPITINIDVGYGEINGSPLSSGALGESETYFNNYSYSQIKNALAASATSADQVSAVNSLPATDPSPNGHGNYWVATAEAKALGLQGASSAVDGYVGFSSSFPFTYNATNGGTVAPGTYDFFGVAAHEISEVMGRELFVGNDGIGSNSYTPLDLFHYSANGVRDFSGTTAGYLSFNGGVTDDNNFNTNRNGDFGDWASSAGNDSYLAFSNSGVGNAVTNADVREMNVLGYDEPLPPPAGFVGDFNGDGNSDLLWQASNGHPTMWLMNGTVITTSTGLSDPGPTWHAIATGDFNADGKSDILWQNVDGLPGIWEMNGTSPIAIATLGNPGPSWRAIATGDFNGDGKADILWQNVDGLPGIWEMNGTSPIAIAALSDPGPSWHAIATGDFNGDGKADILWQNVDGLPAIWEMNGMSIIAKAALSDPGPTWRAVGTADFNGDGKADIIWQNVDGTPGIWEMNGMSPIAIAALPNPGAAWKLIGAGNYNSLHPDLVFLNTSNEQVQIWVMNGMNVSSMQTVGVTAPSTANPASAGAAANPLSASPVLTQPDVFYASLSGSSGVPPLGISEGTDPSGKTLFGRT
jgi:hypothetical protein